MRLHPYALEIVYHNMEVGWVWGGYQPQPWYIGIIFTPQVTQNSQIWGHLGRHSNMMVHPYAHQTAYKWLEHFFHVIHEWGKGHEMNVSLNHGVMVSFSLHKWHIILKSGANLASKMTWWCTHMPSRHHTKGSNTLYVLNMDVGRGLRWISINHDLTMVLFSLHKWPWIPKSRVNFVGVMTWWCTHIPLK